MKTVMRIVCVCCGLALLLSGGAIVSGRAQPRIDAVPDLGVCSGRACYLGIVPGETTIEDARAILRNAPQLALSDYSNLVANRWSQPFHSVQLVQVVSDGVHASYKYVDEIDLVFSGGTGVDAGRIVLQLGEPCALVLSIVGGRTVLIYPGMLLFFALDRQTEPRVFKSTSPVTQIDLFNTVSSCEQVKFGEITRPWHGFGRY